MKDIKNIAASVRQRLLNRANTQGEEFQRTLTRYAIERLLYRLSQSPHSGRFILKGAMLFAIWSEAPFRPTGDVDLLGFGSTDIEDLRRVFAEVCDLEVPADGLIFDAASVVGEIARPEQEYSGVRVQLTARLDGAVIVVQIDIGFGDVVHPQPQNIAFPRLIEDVPRAMLRAYPPESVVAEKFEAMIRFGETTTRLKDFYDLWAIAQTFDFDMQTLATAISNTFARRGTSLPPPTVAVLSNEFAAVAIKQSQWAAFMRRSPPSAKPPALVEVLQELRRFLLPVLHFLNAGKESNGKWSPRRGWNPDFNWPARSPSPSAASSGRPPHRRP